MMRTRSTTGKAGRGLKFVTEIYRIELVSFAQEGFMGVGLWVDSLEEQEHRLAVRPYEHFQYYL